MGVRTRDSAAVEAAAVAFRPIRDPNEESNAQGSTGDSPVVSGDPPETAAWQVARQERASCPRYPLRLCGLAPLRQIPPPESATGGGTRLRPAAVPPYLPCPHAGKISI